MIAPACLASVAEALDSGNHKALRRLTCDLHAANFAEVIEALSTKRSI